MINWRQRRNALIERSNGLGRQGQQAIMIGADENKLYDISCLVPDLIEWRGEPVRSIRMSTLALG